MFSYTQQENNRKVTLKNEQLTNQQHIGKFLYTKCKSAAKNLFKTNIHSIILFLL
jgi:hypothetical protein